jgi:hypothetical protein
MADVEWQLLPALWPEPAVWTDVGELMLLVIVGVQAGRCTNMGDQPQGQSG